MTALRELRKSFRRAFRELPITTAMILISVMCLASRLATPLLDPADDPGRFFPGVSRVLVFTEYPEVRGHFDLWRGQWWRIFANAFHHAGFIHLSFNAIGIWSCAKLVEPALGRWRYTLFFLSAAVASMLPELLMDHDVVGLSGVFFALFGMVLVLRTRNPEIAAAAPASFVYLGFASLFLCVFVSLTTAAPIAHGAHAIGLLYGAITGWLLLVVRRRWPRVSILSTSSLSASLVLAVVITVNPTWKGSFFAWHANEAAQQHEPLERQLLLWNAAAQRDSRISIAWLQAIRIYQLKGDTEAAWAAALRGLRSNRSSDELLKTTRALWSRFSADQKADSLEKLRNLLGAEADAWIARLRLDSTSLSAIAGETLHFEAAPLTMEIPQDAIPQDVLGITKPHSPRGPPAEVDPTEPNSARLGYSL